MSLLKLQRGALSMVVGIITGYCIMGILARRIGLGHLANVFCRSQRDEKEQETVPHLLGTCLALCQRRIKYLGTYHIDDVEELSKIVIGSQNRFIGGYEWFRDQGIADDCGSTVGQMGAK